METGNEILYETFRYKPADTWDKARIDDLGRQTVVDGGKEPRFRSTILDEEVGCEAVGFASIRGYITDSSKE